MALTAAAIISVSVGVQAASRRLSEGHDVHLCLPEVPTAGKSYRFHAGNDMFFSANFLYDDVDMPAVADVATKTANDKWIMTEWYITPTASLGEYKVS